MLHHFLVGHHWFVLKNCLLVGLNHHFSPAWFSGRPLKHSRSDSSLARHRRRSRDLKYYILGCPPSQDAIVTTRIITHDIFRVGNPNLNLHLPLLLGGGTTQIILHSTKLPLRPPESRPSQNLSWDHLPTVGFEEWRPLSNMLCSQNFQEGNIQSNVKMSTSNLNWCSRC